MEFNSVIQTRWLMIFGEQKIKKKKKGGHNVVWETSGMIWNTHVISLTLEIEKAGKAHEWNGNGRVIMSEFYFILYAFLQFSNFP